MGVAVERVGQEYALDAESVHLHFQVSDASKPRGLLRRAATKSQPDRTLVALEDVTLRMPRGQFTALVGTSGCGKTSLLNLFAGINEPTYGSVRVAGRAPKRGTDEIGYMFARDGLLPWRTVRKNVELGLECPGGPSADVRKDRAEELLSYVGLSAFDGAYPSQLSQGMRQRVALARTLAPDPGTLLMDEPFAALDAGTKLRLEAEFLDIWETAGAAEDQQAKSVLFVTHDLQEALLLADPVILMLPNPGRIALDYAISLPRPRARRLPEMLFSEDFRSLYEELFHALEEGSGETPGSAAEGGVSSCV